MRFKTFNLPTSDNLLATTDPALPAPTTIKSYSSRTLAWLIGSLDSHSKDSFTYVNADSNNGGNVELDCIISHFIKSISKYNIRWSNIENIVSLNTQVYYYCWHNASWEREEKCQL